MMTLTEARAIVRTVHYGLDWLHSEETYQKALGIVKAAKPVVEYPPMDWDTDDGSEDSPFSTESERKQEVNAGYDFLHKR